MKKFFVSIFFFFVSISIVKANDTSSIDKSDNEIYLSDLSVVNYTMTPTYEKYNNIYTIITKEFPKTLEIIPIPEDSNSEIEILNNKNFNYGENAISIRVFNLENNQENIYKILLTIENDAINTALFEDNTVPEKEIGVKEISLIVLGCFTLMTFAYSILFPKKKLISKKP